MIDGVVALRLLVAMPPVWVVHRIHGWDHGWDGYGGSTMFGVGFIVLMDYL